MPYLTTSNYYRLNSYYSLALRPVVVAIQRKLALYSSPSIAVFGGSIHPASIAGGSIAPPNGSIMMSLLTNRLPTERFDYNVTSDQSSTC